MRSATGKPTIAAASISGVSGTGRRIPTTVKYVPPRKTWVTGVTRSIPSVAATAEPRTVAG
jgi:hypothetical protein